MRNDCKYLFQIFDRSSINLHRQEWCPNFASPPWLPELFVWWGRLCTRDKTGMDTKQGSREWVCPEWVNAIWKKTSIFKIRDRFLKWEKRAKHMRKTSNITPLKIALWKTCLSFIPQHIQKANGMNSRWNPGTMKTPFGKGENFSFRETACLCFFIAI